VTTMASAAARTTATRDCRTVIADRIPILGGYEPPAAGVGVVPGGEEAMARILGAADHSPNQPHEDHEVTVTIGVEANHDDDDHEHDEDHDHEHHHDHLDDFGSHHVGITMFLRGDGSVDMVSDEIEEAVFKALATRSGHEVVNQP